MIKKILAGLIFISHSFGIHATQKTFERKQDAVLIFRKAPSESLVWWSGGITAASIATAMYSFKKARNGERFDRERFIPLLVISSYVGILSSIIFGVNTWIYNKRNMPMIIISKQGIWHEDYGPYNWEHIDIIRAMRNAFNEDLKWIRVETTDAKMYDLHCSNASVSADRLQLFINEFRPTSSS